MWHFKIVDGVHGTAWAFRGRTRAEVSCIIGLWRRFVTEMRGRQGARTNGGEMAGPRNRKVLNKEMRTTHGQHTNGGTYIWYCTGTSS